MGRQQDQAKWTPAWVAVTGVLAAVGVVLAERNHLLPWPSWGLPPLAVFGGIATVLVGLVRDVWARTHAHRIAVWVAAGGWTTWVSVAGWSSWAWLVLAGCAMTLAALAPLCRTPAPPAEREAIHGIVTPPFDGIDRRPHVVREWENLLRRLTRQPVTVLRVEPWTKPQDGCRVYIELPTTGDLTLSDLTPIYEKVATARRLPNGCSVRLLNGEHQGEAILDVMLRDCLADSVTLDEDFTAASIYDDFTVMTTPRGEPLDICLRSQSMVIGGAPESGKTTLLHRIMLHLARCTDAVIWVADTNGGGLATPFLRPWALRQADRPLVDWVAADEAEAAVMMAVAAAVAKDRKTAPEAVRRRHSKDTTVLPVDAKLPAIIVINDEGGELHQSASLLGQLADAGISRLAQIGRAEAVRAIKSVLRGTGDLMDKGMRVCAGLRICLRMLEDDEYGHVLGGSPGKTKLLHTGSGFMRRSSDPQAIHGRTVNVMLSQIERAAVACQNLRPGAIRNDRCGDLDERGQQVAARVRVQDVLDGRPPANFPDITSLEVMRDVAAGRAYSARWERFASRLAAMRGEDLPEVDVEPAAEPAPSVAPDAGGAATFPGGAIGDLLASADPLPSAATGGQAESAPARVSVDLDDEDTDDGVSELLAGLNAPELTTREQIVLIIADGWPEALTSDQIGTEMERRTGKEGNRTHRQNVLKKLVDGGQIVRVDGTANGGRYTLPKAPQR